MLSFDAEIVFPMQKNCPQNFQKTKIVKCWMNIFNIEHQKIRKKPTKTEGAADIKAAFMVFR